MVCDLVAVREAGEDCKYGDGANGASGHGTQADPSTAISALNLSQSELQDRIETLLRANDFGRSNWHDTASAALTLTYRFETNPASDFPWSNVGGGFQAFTSSQQTAVRNALGKFEDVINVNFVAAAPGQDADISFYRAGDLYTDNPNSTGGARGRWRYSGEEWDGSVVFNAARAIDQARDFDLILHEIGHALGLKHPGNYDVGGNNP
ncbi:MAG: matrixin family metalloprotease, partial [Pseudomonadota bacterium]